MTTNKSQKDIAKEIFVACRTLAGAIAEMKAEGELNVQTRLLGRGRHETKYVLILPENSKKTTGNRNIYLPIPIITPGMKNVPRIM